MLVPIDKSLGVMCSRKTNLSLLRTDIATYSYIVEVDHFGLSLTPSLSKLVIHHTRTVSSMSDSGVCTMYY